MTYVEGASLHQDRGGATVFARYAFNELCELHRRLGDPARLPDPHRGRALVGDELPRGVLGRRWPTAGAELAGRRWRSSSASRCATSAGFSPRRARADRCARRSPTCAAGLLIVLGLAIVLRPRRADDADRPRHRADVGGLRLRPRRWRRWRSRAWSRRPGWRARCASGAAGLKRLVTSASAGVDCSSTSASRSSRSPRCRWSTGRRGWSTSYRGRAGARRRPTSSTRSGWRDGLRYVVAASATVTLIAAAERRRCSACRGWPTRWRRTARSPARSGACTRRARRRTSSS